MKGAAPGPNEEWRAGGPIAPLTGSAISSDGRRWDTDQSRWGCPVRSPMRSANSPKRTSRHPRIQQRFVRSRIGRTGMATAGTAAEEMSRDLPGIPGMGRRVVDSRHTRPQRHQATACQFLRCRRRHIARLALWGSADRAAACGGRDARLRGSYRKRRAKRSA